MAVRAGKGLRLKGTGFLTLFAVLSPTEERSKWIPLVVLTGSNPEKDILRTCDLQARCYITRPVDFLQFVSVVKLIEDFWFTVTKRSNNEDADV